VLFGQNPPYLGVIGGRAAEEIDEARSGHFDLRDLIGLRQRRDQRFGEFARLAARGFGQEKGCIAGKIAVLATALGAKIALRHAAEIANIAAGLVVEKVGTSVVQLEALQAAIPEFNQRSA